MKLRVLLLNPPADSVVIRDYYCSKHTKSNYLFQPIDLLIQSGILASRGHQLHAIDAVARRMGREQCLRLIERTAPHALLGMWGAATDSADRGFYEELCSRLEVPVFVSGEPFLEEPEEWLMERPFLRGLLLRFASEGFADWLESGEPGPDCVSLSDGRVVGGLSPEPPKQFSAGRPRHELFGHKGYRFSFARGKKFATTITDFGCPFKCGFCVMAGLGYRRRPVDEVVGEWRWLKGRGVSELWVSDQCMGADRGRTLDMLARISAEVPGMGFTTFSRADLLDAELVAAMKRAGCHTLIMGVENADPAILRKWRKGLAIEKARAGFDLCREHKIRTVATFIIGLPEDTEDSIRATMALARELDPDFVSYNVAVPRAGTGLREIARCENLAAEGVDPDQGGDSVSMRTRELSREEVGRLKRRAVRDFYLRPGYLARRAASAGSLRALLSEAVEGLALLSKNR